MMKIEIFSTPTNRDGGRRITVKVLDGLLKIDSAFFDAINVRHLNEAYIAAKRKIREFEAMYSIEPMPHIPSLGDLEARGYPTPTTKTKSSGSPHQDSLAAIVATGSWDHFIGIAIEQYGADKVIEFGQRATDAAIAYKQSKEREEQTRLAANLKIAGVIVEAIKAGVPVVPPSRDVELLVKSIMSEKSNNEDTQGASNV